MTLLGAERRRSIRSCRKGWALRAETARGGRGRRTAEPAAAGRKLPPHVCWSTSTLAHKRMPASIRKRRLCSYDRSEVPPESYWLDDAQAAVYFCNARCLCVWSILLATKANLPEEQKTLNLDLVRPGGARLHFVHVRELARWAVENALGRDEANEP